MELDDDDDEAPSTSCTYQVHREINFIVIVTFSCAYTGEEEKREGCQREAVTSTAMLQFTTRGNRPCSVIHVPVVSDMSLRNLGSTNSMSTRYRGFLSAAVALAPEPNAQGQKVKMAQVMFDSSEAAATAKQALDGYTLRPGVVMSVKFIN